MYNNNQDWVRTAEQTPNLAGMSGASSSMNDHHSDVSSLTGPSSQNTAHRTVPSAFETDSFDSQT